LLSEDGARLVRFAQLLDGVVFFLIEANPCRYFNRGEQAEGAIA
jgi:hypothetical protein